MTSYKSYRAQQAKTEARPSWTCSGCGKRLPKTGLVWRRRYDHWDRLSRAGYYCDYCVDCRKGLRGEY